MLCFQNKKICFIRYGTYSCILPSAYLPTMVSLWWWAGARYARQSGKRLPAHRSTHQQHLLHRQAAQGWAHLVPLAQSLCDSLPGGRKTPSIYRSWWCSDTRTPSRSLGPDAVGWRGFFARTSTAQPSPMSSRLLSSMSSRPLSSMSGRPTAPRSLALPTPIQQRMLSGSPESGGPPSSPDEERRGKRLQERVSLARAKLHEKARQGRPLSCVCAVRLRMGSMLMRVCLFIHT